MRFAAAALGCFLATLTPCQAQWQPPYPWLPPDIHYTTDLQELQVAFGSNWIRTGEQIGINIPASAPNVGFLSTLVNVNTSTPYFLALVDPDAPTPANPVAAQYLHWLQPGLTLDATRSADNPFIWTLRNHSAPIVPYARPQPPTYSPAHRYIELLYQQPSQDFVMPAAFSKFNATNRVSFNVSQFAAAAGLGNPIAANYFLVSNQTGTTTTKGSGGANASSTSPLVLFTGAAATVDAKLMACMASMATVVMGGLFVLGN